MLASREMPEPDPEQLHPAIRGLKTVCRCNNIKYRTIERAIRDGACTLSKIAARTTATTGHCGGSCTQDVLAMIEEHGPKEDAAEAGGATQNPAPAGAAPLDAWWVRK